jgi:phosphatidylserine/phosphatidylglycerophosphate/cardiolipin synthase-like enzyme
MSRPSVSLIVQPGDSFFPIVEAIDAARESVKITIFRMDDPIVQHAMISAVERGVRVRALIAANPRGWVKENKALLKELKRAGIETRQPPADTRKKRYHYKVLVVDEVHSLVLTFNPTRENMHYTRDFGLSMRDETVAAELSRLFDADWTDTPYTPADLPSLLVSPYNSREKFTRLLASAERSIDISDAKVQDPKLLELLVGKASQGVRVRILGNDPYYIASHSQLEFRRITRFRLHAKCVIVDGQRAVIGSMNLRHESLDKRREVGVIVDDALVLARLAEVFASDWENRVHSSTAVGRATAASVIVPEPPARFHLLSRTDALSRFPLRDGTTSIGRDAEADIFVHHSSVSRWHARIAVTGDQCTLEDLGSHNGTYLNGRQIGEPVQLRAGDVIGIAEGDEFRLLEDLGVR